MNTYTTTPQLPIVTRRLRTSVSLRHAAYGLTGLVAHIHAAVARVDEQESRAYLDRQYPAFRALLTTGVAALPAATYAALDRALTDLVVEQEPDLDAWVARCADALAPA